MGRERLRGWEGVGDWGWRKMEAEGERGGRGERGGLELLERERGTKGEMGKELGTLRGL